MSQGGGADNILATIAGVFFLLIAYYLGGATGQWIIEVLFGIVGIIFVVFGILKFVLGD